MPDYRHWLAADYIIIVFTVSLWNSICFGFRAREEHTRASVSTYLVISAIGFAATLPLYCMRLNDLWAKVGIHVIISIAVILYLRVYFTGIVLMTDLYEKLDQPA